MPTTNKSPQFQTKNTMATKTSLINTISFNPILRCEVFCKTKKLQIKLKVNYWETSCLLNATTNRITHIQSQWKIELNTVFFFRWISDRPYCVFRNFQTCIDSHRFLQLSIYFNKTLSHTIFNDQRIDNNLCDI